MSEKLKPWRLQLICCGRDEGTVTFETWDEAEAFRESWTSGAGVNPHGFSGRPYDPGHKRAAILSHVGAEPVSEHPSVDFYRRLLAFYDPEPATQWLRLPHKAFLADGTSISAFAMIELGRADEVDAEINRLETGAYV